MTVAVPIQAQSVQSPLSDYSYIPGVVFPDNLAVLRADCLPDSHSSLGPTEVLALEAEGQHLTVGAEEVPVRSDQQVPASG